MSSFYPTMKMNTRFGEEVDDMYNIHGHVGNLSRAAILQSLNVIQTDFRKEQAIVVYYNDQPMNDFNRLSKVIQGDRKVRGNIYPVIIPRTMYEQCLPNNSLDLAISSVATHYMSKQVCQIKNGISIADADDNELSLMREQAKADWRSFVISRGRELKPGGFLVTMNISSDDSGDEPMLVEKGALRLGSFVSDMAKERVITKEEYLATNFNSSYMRTPAEFKEPFTSALPEVRELRLELVSVKSIKHYLQHPTFDIVNKDNTEKMEYSRRIVASIYPWMHHVLYGGLSVSRTEDKKQAIVDEYFDRLQTYAFDHADHKPYLIFTEVVIKKNHI
ncbi:probable S-adenosylmethionine-dependent methyltransferase At5g38780 isoform X3 [Mizuhopecten yessoensis]|uniref:probable S-adenosylmethionine-dependent methyltransferase At5g38780 isoform X3 n=1 Tax=Mizuhopecten yessoensis TaxID=6573 RepID=UPI000B459164|nr:probable S-adenosylmethionine-dependent methyltransferase At5g38780 isoform X3 [Mizuhopecten yessoensis]